MAEEVVKRVEGILEKAKTIQHLANEIYYAMKDVEKFIAEQRRIDEEPNWQLLATLVIRTFQNAVFIESDVKNVLEILQRLRV